MKHRFGGKSVVISLVILFYLTSLAAASTDISGIIAVDATWTVTMSPVIVTDDVVVSNTATLTIDSGVEVRFDSGTELQIEGQLIARGESDNLITFTSNSDDPAPGDWDYIYLTASSVDATYDVNGVYTGGSVLEYCVIEYAGKAEEYAGSVGIGALWLYQASPYVNNCIIRENDRDGIYCEGISAETIKITNNTVVKNRIGIYCLTRIGTISGNIVSDNRENGLVAGSPAGTTLEITGNIIVNNLASAGAGLTFGNSIVTRNVLSGNTSVTHSAALLSAGSATLSTNAVVNNLAGREPSSVNLKDGHDSIFSLNTVTGNQLLAVEFPPDRALSVDGTHEITGNTFANGITYELYNGNTAGSADLDASGNWWNTGTESEIQAKIYDGNDDAARGLVDYSSFLTAPSVSVPVKPPSGVTFEVTASGLTVTWDASSESDLAGYKVYYGTPTGYSFSNVLDAGTNTNVVLTGETAASRVAVTAYDTTADDTDDQAEGYESWFSYAATKPLPPGTIVGTGGDTQVTLQWTKSSGVAYAVSGYRVYRTVTSGSNYQLAVSTTMSGNEFAVSNSATDTSLTNKMRYYYLVTAVNLKGDESATPWETSVMPSNTLAPYVPPNAIATEGDTLVTLSWDAASPGDFPVRGYNIYRTETSGSGYIMVNGAITVTTSYVDPDLTNGTTYYYRVVSIDTNNVESPFSAEMSATPIHINVPPDVTVTAPNGGETLTGTQPITWSATDLEDDPVSIGIYTSIDGGTTWTLLSEDETNDGSYTWDTTTIIDSNRYRVRVAADDGTDIGSDDSDADFEVDNIAFTEISGLITADTVWSVPNSPYILTDEVRVEDGQTLTINPGVEVKFSSGTNLQIDGQLLARGDTDNPITFTSNEGTPAQGDWGSIIFTDSSIDATFVDDVYTGGSIIENSVIEYGGGQQFGAVRTIGAEPFIVASTIRNNANSGIYGSGRVENCTITDNEGGIYALGTADIIDNTITGNGPVWSGIYTDRSTVTIRDNLIKNNVGRDAGGINCFVSTATITGNTVETNEANGDFSSGGGIRVYSGTADITDNLIIGNTAEVNGGGLALLSGQTTVTDNMIRNNTAAVNGGGCYQQLGTVTLAGNIVSGNTATAGSGGGLYNLYGSGTVGTSMVVANTAVTGAAVSFDNDGTAASGPFDLENCIVTANIATAAGTGSAIKIGPLTTVNLHYNTFFNNTTDYIVSNGRTLGTGDVDAENNWWGSDSAGDIKTGIYDWFDDSAKSIVDYTPFLIAGEDGAPMSPPADFKKRVLVNDIILTWTANTETYLAGYKVHYGTPTGYSYATTIDVGNVTTYTLLGVTIEETVALTAYDTEADGIDDQVTWHESWFAEAVRIWAPTVELTEPTGGETLMDEENVTWSANDNDGDVLTVTIYYSADSGVTWILLGENEADDGTFTWDTETVENGSYYRIKVVVDDGTTTAADESTADFNINNSITNLLPVITVNTPNGGEIWTGSENITWTATDNDGDTLTVTLYFSADGGTSWSQIVTGEANDGTYSWDTTQVASGGAYQLKALADDGRSTAFDLSDGSFTIDNAGENTLPVVTVSAPNGGETWTGSQNITWTATDGDDDTLIMAFYYSTDGGDIWRLISALEANDGTFNWSTSSASSGSGFKVKVVAYDGTGTADDLSDAGFTLTNPAANQAPVVTVLTPNGNEIWNGNREITWTATDGDDDTLTMSLYFSSDSGLTWSLISSGQANDGTFTWSTGSAKNASTFRVKAVANDGQATASDRSNSDFSIYNNEGPSVTLTSPNGGETWTGAQNITWTAVDDDSDALSVILSYSTDGGTAWNLIVTEEPDDGSYPWDTTLMDNGSDYLIKVTVFDGILYADDFSGSSFTITNTDVNHSPSVVLNAPAGGETWFGVQNITWSAADKDRETLMVDIYYSNNSGTSWQAIAIGEENDRTFPWNTMNLTDGTTYRVRVAVSDGQVVDDDESSSDFTVYNGQEELAPDPPRSLAAAAGNNVVYLDWLDSREPDLSHYNVYRGTTLEIEQVTPLVSSITASTYQDNTATNGTTYYYAVSAVDTGDRESTLSNSTAATPMSNPPTASLSADITTGTVPLAVTYTVAGNDDGQVLRYDLDFGPGRTRRLSSPGDVLYRYTDPGTYTAELIVTDDDSLVSGPDRETVTTDAHADAPAAILSTSNIGGPAPLAITFTYSGTDQKYALIRYQIDFEGDGRYDHSSDAAGQVAYTYGRAGLYRPVLRVMNSEGLTDRLTESITVGATTGDDVTVQAFAAGEAAVSGQVPFPVAFTGLGHGGTADVEGNYARYLWDFEGDGVFDYESAAAIETSHTYTDSGTYAPTLRVVDLAGLWGDASCLVTVTIPAGEMTAWMSEPPAGVRVYGTRVTVKAETTARPLVQQMAYRYRPAAGGDWTTIGDAVLSSQSVTLADSWDVSGLTEDSEYNLSAIATTLGGSTVETNTISVTIDSDAPDVNDGLDGAARRNKEQDVASGTGSEVEIEDGTALSLPNGAIPADTTASLTLHDTNPQSNSGVTGTLLSFREITLDGDPDLGQMVNITIPYEETGGTVKGTSLSETLLVPCYWDGLEWNRIPDYRIDLTNNLVTFSMEHLTQFALLAEVPPVPAVPAAGLGSGDDNCFIATAAYGSKLAAEVKLLRRFRDRCLLPHSVGCGLVTLYYTLSPPLANIIAQNENLRKTARTTLKPIIRTIDLLTK